MALQKSVFVQIPSYRDKQLIPTLQDLIRNSSSPENLRIAVCWQHGEDERLADFVDSGFRISDTREFHGQELHLLKNNGASVELIDVHYLKARGLGWARNFSQKLYRGESYTLQIDAHHRFIAGWDTVMMEMLESMRAKYKKPVLTGYPPSFDPGTYPDGRQEFPVKMLFGKFSPPALVSFRSKRMEDWQGLVAPIRARFISGGFVFADGAIINEVMSDEHHFFGTEEIIMAVRAYTHGYDFFHPHKILLWHQYNSDSAKIWDDHGREASEAALDIPSFARASYERALSILGIGEGESSHDFSEYGLGPIRTVRQYERYAGVSFKHRGVRHETKEGSEPDESHFDTPDDEWESGLVCARVLKVVLNQDNLMKVLPESRLVLSIFEDGSDVAAEVEIPKETAEEVISKQAKEFLVGVEVGIFKGGRRYQLISEGSSSTPEIVMSDGIMELY